MSLSNIIRTFFSVIDTGLLRKEFQVFLLRTLKTGSAGSVVPYSMHRSFFLVGLGQEGAMIFVQKF